GARMRDNRMLDAGRHLLQLLHVFMAQIIAVINNNKNKVARTGSGSEDAGPKDTARQGDGRGPKDELKDVDGDAISTEFCSINDKL
ncbi:hypothetical protein KR018_010851, partial [Drosophila ironensis]